MTGLLCDASTQINPTSLFDVLLLSRPLGAFCISVWYHWIHFLGPLLLHCQPMGHVLVDSVDSLDCSGMRKMHRGYARVHANTHRPESNGYTCVFMPSRCSEVLYCMLNVWICHFLCHITSVLFTRLEYSLLLCRYFICHVLCDKWIAEQYNHQPQ